MNYEMAAFCHRFTATICRSTRLRFASQMARDPATPATARLAACRELLRLKKKPPRAPEAQQEEAGDECSAALSRS